MFEIPGNPELTARLKERAEEFLRKLPAPSSKTVPTLAAWETFAYAVLFETRFGKYLGKGIGFLHKKRNQLRESRET